MTAAVSSNEPVPGEKTMTGPSSSTWETTAERRAPRHDRRRRQSGYLLAHFHQCAASDNRRVALVTAARPRMCRKLPKEGQRKRATTDARPVLSERLVSSPGIPACALDSGRPPPVWKGFRNRQKSSGHGERCLARESLPPVLLAHVCRVSSAAE